MTPQEFRRIRKSQGLTQADLASLIGFVDANQIHRMETGKRSISTQTAIIMRILSNYLILVVAASEKEKRQ